MIQGQTTKYTPTGLHRTNERNPPSRISKPDKKLTEKTKFTLQYDLVSGKSKSSLRAPESGKRAERAPQEEAQIRRTAKSDLLCPGAQDGQRRVRKDQIPNSKFTARKDARPSKERQIRNSSISVPFIKSSATKTSVARKTSGTLKRTTATGRGATTTAVTPKPKESSVHVAPSKTKNVYFKTDAEGCDVKSKSQDAKTSAVKKSTACPSAMKLAEAPRQPANLELHVKKSVANYEQCRSDDDDDDDVIPSALSTAAREVGASEIEDGDGRTESSIKRMMSEGYLKSLGLGIDVPERKCSEDLITAEPLTVRNVTAEPEPRRDDLDLSRDYVKIEKTCDEYATPDKMLSDREDAREMVETEESAQDLIAEAVEDDDEDDDDDDADAKSSSTIAEFAPPSECRRLDEEEDKKLTESSENLSEDYEDDARAETPERTLPLAPAPEKEAQLEALKKQSQNYELLNLDKRIWSDLEVEIRQTCEKTDFLYESGADSAESLTDMMDKLVPSREESEARKEDAAKKAEKRGAAGVCRKTRSSRPPSKPRTSDRIRTWTKDDAPIKKPEATRGRKTVAEIEVVVQPEKIVYEESAPKDPPAVHMPKFQADARAVGGFFDTHPQVAFIGKSEDEDYISFQVEKMKLYQPQESQMLLCDTANCMAARAYLKMCGLSFDVVLRKNAEQMSPSGKVPFIASGPCIIPEFEAIVSFMQYRKIACSLVDERDKAAFRSLLSAVVDILEVSERYICWYDDEILKKYTKPRIGGHYPFPLNYIMNWKKGFEERRRLADEGTTRKSFDVIMTEVNNCFRTLSQHLGSNTFFFRNTCTELDALVYGHLYALFTVPSIGVFKEIQVLLLMYPNLLNFALNFDKMYTMNVFGATSEKLMANFPYCEECCRSSN